MTKIDEFVEKIEHLDPHFKVVRKPVYETATMIVWYYIDDDFRYPYVVFTVNQRGENAVKTNSHLLVKNDLVLYSEVIKLCIDYFPFLFDEWQFFASDRL